MANDGDTALNGLLREFLLETRDTLEAVEVCGTALVGDPADAVAQKRLLELVHSVKGACGYLPLPRLESVAAAVTEAADALDEDGGLPEPEKMEAILSAVGRMRDILDSVDATGIEPPGADSELIETLVAIAEEEAPAAADAVADDGSDDGGASTDALAGVWDMADDGVPALDEAVVDGEPGGGGEPVDALAEAWDMADDGIPAVDEAVVDGEPDGGGEPAEAPTGIWDLAGEEAWSVANDEAGDATAVPATASGLYVVFEAGGQAMALDAAHVTWLDVIEEATLSDDFMPIGRVRGEMIPLCAAEGGAMTGLGDGKPVIVLGVGGQQVGLVADEIVGVTADPEALAGKPVTSVGPEMFFED